MPPLAHHRAITCGSCPSANSRGNCTCMSWSPVVTFHIDILQPEDCVLFTWPRSSLCHQLSPLCVTARVVHVPKWQQSSSTHSQSESRPRGLSRGSAVQHLYLIRQRTFATAGAMLSFLAVLSLAGSDGVSQQRQVNASIMRRAYIDRRPRSPYAVALATSCCGWYPAGAATESSTVSTSCKLERFRRRRV